MTNMDDAYTALESLVHSWSTDPPILNTESDVRLKFIDPIFSKVLEWPLQHIKTEDHTGNNGFIDYNFQIECRSRLIVEAKRDQVSFGLRPRTVKTGYKLNGPVFSDAAAVAGVEQAIRYCGTKNTELACLTNGNEWIVFRGNRAGDGLDSREGMGFAFASINEVLKNFAFFYDLLSFSSVNNLTFRPLFQEAEGRRIRTTGFCKSLVSPGGSRLLPVGKLSADIEDIMSNFFDRLTSNHDDPEMLIECFVESNESRAADAQLARISEDIIGKIRNLETGDAAALTKVIERAAKNRRHEFVLIVGQKGAGKSTFITRFFEVVLKDDLASRCVSIRVNLADSPGDARTLNTWLDRQLLEEAEKQIFPEGSTFEDLEGMFYDEYTRLRKGSWSRIYQSDKQQFQIKFGDWVEDKREHDPHFYISGLIRHVVTNRKLLPVLVFDNSDHHQIEFQEAVYQYARSFYESQICLIIIPITDRTNWNLSRHGALQSFEHEALFLPTPQTEQILRKRVEYFSQRVDMRRRRPDDRYFVTRGISWTLDDLHAFALSLNDIFLNTAEVARYIGKLANYDVRRSLRLARLFITSPQLEVEDLLKAYLAGTAYSVNRGRAVRALIRGRYDSYPHGQHEFVQNLYAVAGSEDSSPLIALRVLQLLEDAGATTDNELIHRDEILRYMNDIRLEPTVVLAGLDDLLKSGLVQNYDPTLTEVDQATQIEITPSGSQHLQWAQDNFEYLSAMADASPIRSGEAYENLRDTIKPRGGGWLAKVKVFAEYLIQEDQKVCVVPDHPSYSGQLAIISTLEGTVTSVQRILEQRR